MACMTSLPKDGESSREPSSPASDIARLQQAILRFAAEREWQQFHDPKNLAMAVAVEAGVNFFKAADEVEDLVSRVGAAGGCAEMRAATEGAGFVDHTTGGFGIEQRAGFVGGVGERFSAGGAEGFGGDESLASREPGNFSGEMELAAFGAEGAIPLQWASC